MGSEGVRILDVGTGPAPVPYAVQDFYASLRTFGRLTENDSLARQDVDVEIIESSEPMNSFVHHFSQISERPGPFRPQWTDFANVDLTRERNEARDALLRMSYYDPLTRVESSEYSSEEANWIAQRQNRYRLIVFSNFFTLNQTLDAFEPEVRALFADLRPGSMVAVLAS
jgi:hypothetical protein